MPIDRTQREYRAIEILLTPHLQDMLDKAFEMYRDEADKKYEKGNRNFNQEKLWDKILKKLPLSHYEAKLLDIANSIWGGSEIRLQLIEFGGFDPINRVRIIMALATYLNVSHVIKTKGES